MDFNELWKADETDARAIATRNRNVMIHTFGNLTLVTQSLNSAASNSPWQIKKAELLNSLLPINQPLHAVDAWDELGIERRSKEMFARALTLWSCPDALASA
jgi:hypothetical protein